MQDKLGQMKQENKFKITYKIRGGARNSGNIKFIPNNYEFRRI